MDWKNNPWCREAVCRGLEEFGVVLDDERNESVHGEEGEVSSADSKVKVFVVPANEELVLAREVYRKVTSSN